MQICGADSRKKRNPKTAKANVFALGDITHTSLNEEKGVMAIVFMAPVIYRNICLLSEKKGGLA